MRRIQLHDGYIDYYRIDDAGPGWVMGFRDITNATDTRTDIAAILPDHRRLYEIERHWYPGVFVERTHAGPVQVRCGRWHGSNHLIDVGDEETWVDEARNAVSAAEGLT